MYKYLYFNTKGSVDVSKAIYGNGQQTITLDADYFLYNSPIQFRISNKIVLYTIFSIKL
jgi:hypothetical protein